MKLLNAFPGEGLAACGRIEEIEVGYSSKRVMTRDRSWCEAEEVTVRHKLTLTLD